jgi:hypothetical protein
MEEEGHSDVESPGKAANGVGNLLRSVGQLASNFLPKRTPKK